ncbi:non-ribosomal peptide synthetase [Actinokineospora inagensis]|uniref:non-ribosomal peptide synthetase n=1 Tax=Actinokineospora inagensis TaxID=103730 RepID=UPI000415A1BD|nr:non-ribosomal peptide synthetase [Actinokineospora inagensis]
MGTLIDAVLSHADDRAALADGAGRRWTYGQLRARVSAVAADLARGGVGPGGRVAVVGERTADTVIALLAALHVGAAYCVLDPDLPAARREVVLDALAPDRVLVVARTPDGVPTAPFPGRPDDLAYVIFTSGSTGTPKGVMVEHGSVLNMLRSYDILAPPGDRLAGSLVAPCGFDVSVWEIFSVLTRGGELHVPGAEALRDGEALWRFVVASSVTSAYVPPGLLGSVVAAAERDRTGRVVLDRVLVGVEPIPQGLLDRFRNAVPGLRVVNGYGPTEATITATLHLLDAVTEPNRRTPIGGPVLGSEVELLDDRLEPVPPGELGEIVVFGACLARGYLGAAGGGFQDVRGRRAYRTGDYARLRPDGALEFAGRRDGQVKINGFRVEIGDVEAALVAVPGVRRGLVLVTGDPGALRLIAAVEVLGTSGSTVHEHLAARLPAYLAPSRVIAVSSFPLTANGKVDTMALLAADRRRQADASGFVPAATDDQRRVAEAWAAVLGVAEVGLDDDFHMLGGTSLDAVRIAARLTDDSSLVPATAVLQARTVRGFCALEPLLLRVSTPAEPGRYPASRAQEGLWAWRRLRPDDASSTVVHAIDLGEVDPERVRRALTAVVARHEALRTTFHGTGAGVEQLVAPPRPLDLPVAPVTERSDVDRRLRDLLGHRFDVAVRAWTAELLVGPDFTALVFAADHLVFDGESAAVLERDLLADGPGAAVAGAASVITRPTLERAAVARAYWAQVLSGLADVRPLPEPLERTPAEGRRRLARTLPDTTRALVAALARAERTTPFVVVLAALKAFLRARCDAADNVVSIAVSQRQSAGCPDAIGHFVNLVPVRDVEPDDGLSFVRYLAGVVDLTRESLAHGDLPFEDIVAMLPRPAGDGVAPARVVLAQEAARGPRSWPRIPLNSLHDLAVFLADNGVLTWVWDTARTLPGTAEWTAEAFEAFLAAVVARPDRPLADAPVLAAAEAALISTTADGREVDHSTVVDLVAHQVRTRPDAVAVQDGDRLVSYAELDRRAEEIRARLPAGPVVAIVLAKSADLPVAMLAVLRAGSAYLPLAPEHAPTRLADLIRRSGATACVTSSDLARVPHGTSTVLVDQPGDRPAPEAPRLTAGQLAYVMPTSGSTGEPKLVGVPHRAVARLVHRSSTFPLDHDDRTMLVSNSSFDAATFEIWGALANGGRVVVPTVEELREPTLLCRAIERHGITAGFFTVTLFQRLVAAEPSRLAGMRHLLVGGEAVPPALIAEAARHIPRTSLLNGYGPTENTTFSCCHRQTENAPALRSVPIGAPITGSGAVIVDARRRPLPIGVAGEILVTGAGLAVGYLNDAELTRGRFVRFRDRAAYRTGDLGRLLPDGTLEYLGRMDRQVKVRGFRVEPGEVEAALERHPAVRRATAYGKDVAGANTLHAAVEAGGVSGRELRSWLASLLPDYAVPSQIAVVEAFPMTANGKLDRAALLPEPSAEPPGERPELEHKVGRIWSELLGLPAIGLDDDVFACGADSMTVLAVTERIRQDLGRAVPAHVVYTVRTVHGLASYLRDSAAVDDSGLREATERRAAVRRKARSRRTGPGG